MSYSSLETVVHIPSIVGKLMTQAALALALLLALAVNRNLVVRPNTFLVIATVIAVAAFMVSIRDEVSVIGSDYRAVRLIVFVATLWLLTPWWGRKDMFLLRCQLRALAVVLGSVLLGLAVAPGKAFSFEGRLGGRHLAYPRDAGCALRGGCRRHDRRAVVRRDDPTEHRRYSSSAEAWGSSCSPTPAPR